MKLKSLVALITAGIVTFTGICADAAEITKQTSHRLAELSRETNVDIHLLRHAVSHATYQPKIIEMITKPWESKPWYKYRTIFLTDKRINEGAAFLKRNLKELERAEQVFGVEKEIIVAILGVETTYGQNMGSWKIVDALYTLGFHYPKRAQYFSKEFANYVKLASNQEWDVDGRSGSYAGAMGMAQFMPSSYLSYAVDFNRDGKKDLFYSPSDAIGSIANYFKNSKWVFGKPVAFEAEITKRSAVASLLGGKPIPNVTVGELKRRGVEIYAPRGAVKDQDKVKLLELDGDDGKIYYVVYPNFVSITRYNTSPLYAMAVYQLSQEIRRKAGYRIDEPGFRPGHHRNDMHDNPVHHDNSHGHGVPPKPQHNGKTEHTPAPKPQHNSGPRAPAPKPQHGRAS